MGKQKKKNKSNDLFVFRLSSRAALFLFLQTIAGFLFYISGNFQGFLDKSLRFILVWCAISSILLILFSIVGLFQCIISFFVTFKWRYWLYFLLYLLALIISPILFVSLSALNLLASGV